MSDTHETQIVTVDERETALQRRGPSLAPIVAAVMNRSGAVDTATLERLLDLQERYDANEARKAYTAALVGLKRDLPAVIAHDGLVDFGEGKRRTTYTHATLAGVMSVIDPILTSHGFTVTYKSQSRDHGVEVTCRITHCEGHFEDHGPLFGKPDSSGNKNPTQGIASTMTYLQRYLVLTSLGIATKDMKGEPQGPPKEARAPDSEETIDTRRNSMAARAVVQAGNTKEDAERIVGKPIERWTYADRMKIKGWLAGEPSEEMSDGT